jgi:GT2 family glycosyltransferase
MIGPESRYKDKEMINITAPENNFLASSAMESSMDRVAIVIPALNRPDLLAKCLESLACQTLPAGVSEVLVCDDGSSVDLATVVGSFGSRLPEVRLVRQQPKGPAAARNLGFRSSPADIFVCIDSDVICADGFIDKLVEALRRNADWVAAEATVLPAGEQGLFFDAPVNRGGTYGTGASAYRRTALLEAGGLDESFPFPACEDAELAARLLRLGPYGYVPDAIVYHPTRRVTWHMQWRSRKYWRYVMILAKRYGILAFPGRPASPLPRLRVALAAVVTLPAGRLLEALKYAGHNPGEGLCACAAALFDVICGLAALPEILFAPVPERKNYLRVEKSRV